MDFDRVKSLASNVVSHASSAFSAVASRLLPSSSTLPTSPPLPPCRPYHGPDLLSRLSHDLHAHIFTFLPLRSLLASARLSTTYSQLTTHPVADELYRQQLFDPLHPQLCSDRAGGEAWRDYVGRVVDVERRLVGGGGEEGVLYDVGGCDEDAPRRGPRMYVAARHFDAANYNPVQQLYWAFEQAADTPFPIPGMLVLKQVCWLQVSCLIRLPSPPRHLSPFHYRVYWRLGVSERSNLGGPTFSVEPAEGEEAVATSASRVVHNDQLRRLIEQPYTHIPGVGDEKAPDFIPQPTETEEAGGGEEPQQRRPRNQADALMTQLGPRHIMRRRRVPLEERQGGIRPERVMRELLIGEVAVHARETVQEVERSNGKDEKKDGDGEEKQRVEQRGNGCGDVRMWVRCLKIGNNEGWKSNVSFDCVIAERMTY